MSDPKAMLTTSQFAKKAGVSTSTVSKWIRSGKVTGTKQGGKWMISEDQLEKTTSAPSTPAAPKPAAAPKAPKSSAPKAAKKGGGSTHSIEAFSELTYLTPFGVKKYLKEGKLTGSINGAGEWEVDASNLEKKEIQHLIR